MRFWMVGGMVPGMRQVVGFGDRSKGRPFPWTDPHYPFTEGVILGANVGCPIVTNGEFAA